MKSTLRKSVIITAERPEVARLSEAKKKEWYQWGKEAYKSTANMARTNCHHPDYNTKEKVEALHDNYGDSYLLKPERIEVLKSKWGYTDEAVAEALQQFKDGYNGSRQWYAKADKKFQAVIDQYKPIFDEASKIAHSVDVSDIRDGFPCGSAHLYLQKYPEAEELYKALAHFSSSSTDVYKYELPIKFPTHGQCIAFDERICKVVNDYLRTQGIFASVYSWID